ncbi:MAG: hypothetical protein GOMPHAMPRED_008090 [Gomphillus americanus]|uniref:Tetratricopeptide repeat protein n=1 Tax=Gomphillus americanus TaxID=1940652 RepID=A0A8H3EYH1_9LECA|nr:MAG: hypothetical protein GOMPHAMPRED_008090 [Gomphillus americanus]
MDASIFVNQEDKEAVNIPIEGDLDRVDRLQYLAAACSGQYLRIEALNDLEYAIQLFQEAVDLTPEDHPDRVVRLQPLAALYGIRYQQTGALDDLELCIQLFQKAVNLTPEDHPDQAVRLQGLAAAYSDQYLRTGVLSDIELCIKLFQEAVNLTPEDHPDRAGRLQYLATLYGKQYEQTETLNDLELCIRLFQKAINLTPEDHPSRAGRLWSLAMGYSSRYRRIGAADDLELSVQRNEEALNHKPSPPIDRLRAGRALFEAYAKLEKWQLAYQAVSLTMSFIPLLTSRSLKHLDVQHRVNEIAGLASDAAATALRIGKPVYEAIQLLEVGRGVVANSLSDIRSDVSDLNMKFPYFAKRFSDLRNLLDSPKDLEKDDQRYDTGKQLEELIQQVRDLPGFDRFLLGPSKDELRKIASRGPIIIVNVSEYGCNALIIEQEKVGAIELPLLRMKDIRIKANKLASPDNEILEWLWDKVACPVLNSLNFVQTH